ncbi:MAG: class I SAM-dependent methyltransferase [Candidatus Pristimantibacillus sp.]
MDPFDYKIFYDEVGTLNGWDFSKVKVTAEGVKWDYYNEVIQRCKQSDRILDIGTGGGETLISIAHIASLLVGIDLSSVMIEKANENLVSSNQSNLQFIQMDADHLEFPERYFNMVSCRHSPFNAVEVAKVLVKDGLFLTQQVSEFDKFNLTQAFGRGQHTDPDGALKNRYMNELNEAGFLDIQSFEYDAIEYYTTYEDLVFLLKHTPIIPSFGQDHHDFEILQRFIMENETEKGIQTNSKRFMLIAKKG